MLPSMRVMVRLAKNSPKIQSRILEPTSTSRSRLVMPARCRGVMEALHPSTKKMLKRLLPITLPIAISEFFLRAATMEVASSGRDVPPDDGLADSQTAGNACGTVYKEVTADDKPCQSTYHI